MARMTLEEAMIRFEEVGRGASGTYKEAWDILRAKLKEAAPSTNMTKGEIISVLISLDYNDRIEILREFCRMGGCER